MPFMINLEPKKRAPKHFSKTEKMSVINIFNTFQNDFPDMKKLELVRSTAQSAGICVASVYKILNEYKNNQDVLPPKKTRTRKTIFDKLDMETKRAIRQKVHSFFSNNETPTVDKICKAIEKDESMPNFKKTTLQKLLRDLGFRYHKDGIKLVSTDIKTEDKAEKSFKNEEIQELFICNVCLGEFQCEEEYQTHMKWHEENLTCKLCHQKFETILFLGMHLSEHDENKSYCCPCCTFKTATRKGLISHINECNSCKKVFERPGALKKLETNTTFDASKEIKELCDVCGKGFSRPSYLKTHYLVHSGIKPYKCSYCEKRFYKKKSLVLHERVHSGEKPYSCKQCHKSFSQQGSLICHIRTHIGERPYECPFCSASYVSNTALNSHKKHCKGYTSS